MRERTMQHLAPEGFHQVAYREWGDPANDRVLICVHGISRNGRDFDNIAEALSDEYRVLCPDMPGRGASEFLQDKSQFSLNPKVQPKNHFTNQTILLILQEQDLDF